MPEAKKAVKKAAPAHPKYNVMITDAMTAIGGIFSIYKTSYLQRILDKLKLMSKSLCDRVHMVFIWFSQSFHSPVIKISEV